MNSADAKGLYGIEHCSNMADDKKMTGTGSARPSFGLAPEKNYLAGAICVGVLLNSLCFMWQLQIAFFGVAAFAALLVKVKGNDLDGGDSSFANFSRSIMTRLNSRSDEWLLLALLFLSISMRNFVTVDLILTSLLMTLTIWMSGRAVEVREAPVVRAVAEPKENEIAVSLEAIDSPKGLRDDPKDKKEGVDEDGEDITHGDYEDEQRERWEGWIKDEINRLDKD
jgi:hypothetical protein